MKAKIQQTFNSVADQYGTGGARFFSISGQTMADLYPLNGDEHVLDVASGTGALAIPLARHLPQGKVTAVDFSSGMLARSRCRAEDENLGNIEYIEQDMTAMVFDDGLFDHAYCAFGLFFVEDMVALLEHIGGNVKTGGTVTVSGFCGQSFMPAAALIFDRLKSYGIDVPDSFSWQRMSEPDQLDSLFSSAGLSGVDITRKSLGYYTDPVGWWEVVWNAGFRGLVEQLGDKLDEFRREHLEEVAGLMDDQGLWLEVDVNFTRGVRV